MRKRDKGTQLYPANSESIPEKHAYKANVNYNVLFQNIPKDNKKE